VQEYDSKIALSDKVLVYCVADVWKIVAFNISISYPIIYDKFIDNDKSYDMTIVLCPITLQSVILKGKFKFKTYEKLTMILEDDEGSMLPIDMGYKIDKKYIIRTNKRTDIKIMTLKTAITGYAMDCLYVKTNPDIVCDPVINISYYSNNLDYLNKNLEDALIHPKTLAYVIYFKSHEMKDKISIVLGKDTDKYIISGYDFKKSKIMHYLYKYQKKIINKYGFVMQMLWCCAKELYPEAKIIYISE